ncbi:MAG: hypothetical protein AAF725_20875 [Acidobacteriota bacterium]
MIRSLAVAFLLLVVLFIFQPQIQASLFEARHALSLSRVDLESEKKSELRDAVSRVADGYGAKRFTETERSTLEELLRELRSFEGEVMPEEKADVILERVETVLERYE